MSLVGGCAAYLSELRPDLTVDRPPSNGFYTANAQFSDVSSHPLLSLEETPFSAEEFSRLWLVAAATYGVGDVVTTIALLRVPRVSEGNTLVLAAIDAFGQSGLVGMKILVFCLCIGISLWSAHSEDRFGYYLPPAALAVAGAFTTAFNLRLLLG